MLASMARALVRWWCIVLDVLLGRWYCRGLPPLKALLARTTSGARRAAAGGERGEEGEGGGERGEDPRGFGSAPSHACARHLTVIVTGPTSGIGMETARCFAECGARVVMACRTVQKGEELAARWRAGARGRELRVEVMELDMADLGSVRRFARAWRAQKQRGSGTPGDAPTRVDALINNAGVFDMSGKYSRTRDGFEAHFGVNYLSQVLPPLTPSRTPTPPPSLTRSLTRSLACRRCS